MHTCVHLYIACMALKHTPRHPRSSSMGSSCIYVCIYIHMYMYVGMYVCMYLFACARHTYGICFLTRRQSFRIRLLPYASSLAARLQLRADVSFYILSQHGKPFRSMWRQSCKFILSCISSLFVPASATEQTAGGLFDPAPEGAAAALFARVDVNMFLPRTAGYEVHTRLMKHTSRQ